MNEADLQLYLKEGEGLSIESKEHFSNKIDRDIVAFANSQGGKILLGVNDNGSIVSETLTNELKARICDLARNCEPSINIPHIETINDVDIISIEESQQKPHSCGSGYYRRLDAATQKMNQQELKILFDVSDTKPRFEELFHSESTWDNISILKIQSFL